MLRAPYVRATLGAVAMAMASNVVAPRVAAAKPDPSKVKDIKTFIECLNMIKGEQRSLHHALKCVPPCCNFVVTMSRESAQAACELGGCKLPRVIFDCPGPTADRRFRPSFLLCPTDSKSGGQFGTDRVEIGEDVDGMGNMKMADVPAPPGATDFGTVTEGDVLSKVTNDDFGTKGCNQGCHDVSTPAGDADNNQLSKPINPFGKFGSTDLAPFIIDTDEPGHSANPAMKMSLKDICKCIKENKDKIKQAANDPNVVPDANQRNPNLDVQLLLKLCKKLKRKLPDKPCGTPRNTWTPTPTEPPPTQTPTHTPKDTPTDTPLPTPMETPSAPPPSTASGTPGMTPSPPATP